MFSLNNLARKGLNVLPARETAAYGIQPHITY